MGEYGREQRKQESRVIANSETGSRQLKGFVDNRNINLVNPLVQCNTLQRTVTAEAGADATITAELTQIDNNAGQDNSTILNTVCGDDATLSAKILEASASIGDQNCGGVSRDAGGVIHAESCIFNRLSDTEKEKVSQINNRPSGVHSEVHHYNAGNLASVWTSQPNCFFCSGFLQHAGIGHQSMRTSYIFPQMWTSDGGRWKIVKDVNKYDWDILHDTAHGKYKKEV